MGIIRTNLSFYNISKTTNFHTFFILATVNRSEIDYFGQKIFRVLRGAHPEIPQYVQITIYFLSPGGHFWKLLNFFVMHGRPHGWSQKCL